MATDRELIEAAEAAEADAQKATAKGEPGALHMWLRAQDAWSRCSLRGIRGGRAGALRCKEMMRVR